VIFQQRHRFLRYIPGRLAVFWPQTGFLLAYRVAKHIRSIKQPRGECKQNNLLGISFSPCPAFSATISEINCADLLDGFRPFLYD
jgi:hypothetical protein